MNSQRLKIIAVLTMLIDHIGFTLNALQRYALAGPDLAHYMSDAYWQWRVVGRLAFPLFAFLIAEGCAHSRDILKYIKRLALFALISQLPYQLFSNLGHGRGELLRFSNGSVMVTLALGATAVYCYRQSWQEPAKKTLFALGIVAAFVGMIVLRGEYDFCAMLIILLVYMFRPKTAQDADAAVSGSRHKQAAACAIITGIYYVLTTASFNLTAAAVSASLLLWFYNGQPGQRRWQLAFYIFYPAHLLALSAIMYAVMA